ncbi:MAG: sterol desaturase/sphingolipid hydroxylase (fatty acid hydroxylase superfamily) [Candidatus Azotimanducaceae bacterium]|jgi:sterol desaturase/sphingolipid hydroxylase (fatty acid hydroxylase superfamily)
MRNRQNFFWSLPQPAIAFGFMLLVASAITTEWTDADLLTSILLLSPIPLLLVAERLKPKRADWTLNWRDLAEDSFWVLSTYLIWLPIYNDYYETPISDGFEWLREASAFPFALEGQTVFGLMIAALVGILVSEFIYYWIHRLQHRVMFFWRMHATHHHVTKMSVARADRTHPLEFLGLTLGSVVALAFLGASDDVIAVSLVFRVAVAYMNHSNLPMTPGFFGLIFNTPSWHQVHHSLDYNESNNNFGCIVIVWDRVFGTFLGKDEVDQLGNGKGEPLTIAMQLTMPFRSDETLKSL